MRKTIIFFLLLSFLFVTGFFTTTRFNPSGWEDNGIITSSLSDRNVNMTGNFQTKNITIESIINSTLNTTYIEMTRTGDLFIFI